MECTLAVCLSVSASDRSLTSTFDKKAFIAATALLVTGIATAEPSLEGMVRVAFGWTACIAFPLVMASFSIEVRNRLDANDERVSNLESGFTRINQRVDALEKHVISIASGQRATLISLEERVSNASGQRATLISLEERVSKLEVYNALLRVNQDQLEENQRRLDNRVTSFTGRRCMSVDSLTGSDTD